METAGHTETRLMEVQGFGHIEMHNPGIKLLIKEVDRVSDIIDKNAKE
jgi:hypothetical protein